MIVGAPLAVWIAQHHQVETSWFVPAAIAVAALWMGQIIVGSASIIYAAVAFFLPTLPALQILVWLAAVWVLAVATLGYTQRMPRRIRAAIVKEKLTALASFKIPTYVVGVDSAVKRAYLVSTIGQNLRVECERRKTARRQTPGQRSPRIQRTDCRTAWSWRSCVDRVLSRLRLGNLIQA